MFPSSLPALCSCRNKRTCLHMALLGALVTLDMMSPGAMLAPARPEHGRRARMCAGPSLGM